MANAKEGRTEQSDRKESEGGSEERRSSGGAQGRSAERRGGEMAPWTPSMFALSPREFWTASPFDLMRRFTEEMGRWFDGFGPRAGAMRSGRAAVSWAPPVEILERDNHLLVRAELPGMKKEDVKVEVREGDLVIHGERRREHEERREGMVQSEWSYGEFYRRLPLPDDVDASQANGRFHDGILEISLPIVEERRKGREIPIEAGSREERPQK
ncbi:MAG: Hsp20/alpha crystallin family protein [Candidatus Eisenbacteria bacterium]|nr:Hsp20/alpha crystallin family protein [Candidatus Eisenbacteria bacterium]